MRITKAMKKDFEEKAKVLVAEYNPYIKKSIPYQIGSIPMFVYGDKSYTKEELDRAYIETAVKDITSGFNDRSVGYYDKWYRYERYDEGRAYDIGQCIASDSGKCPENLNFIEIAECNRP